MTFADQVELVNDQAFRDKVTMAMVVAAQQFISETRNTPGYGDYYARREGLAAAVIAAPSGLVDRFVWNVAANPAVTAQATDNDIQFTVNTHWDDIAGIPAADRPAAT